MEFAVGDHVFFRVILTIGVRRVINLRKLSPRFIGPYQVLRLIGSVAYEIVMSPQLSNLYLMFHVSHLRKYVLEPSHVLEVKDM